VLSEIARGEARVPREGFMPRDNIVLQCGDCKSRNYVTTKNKKTTPDRLEFQEVLPTLP
jgi:large subunit ribosomal protein L33